jgi:hypothetical protein
MDGACEVEVEDEDDGYDLTVTRCMFHEVLVAEDLTQLLAYFCCQHNMSWLAAYKQQGVEEQLNKCMARGDKECCMTVRPSAT